MLLGERPNTRPGDGRFKNSCYMWDCTKMGVFSSNRSESWFPTKHCNKLQGSLDSDIAEMVISDSVTSHTKVCRLWTLSIQTGQEGGIGAQSWLGLGLSPYTEQFLQCILPASIRFTE